MYIPDKYLQTDQQQILQFMRRYSFGTIISIKDNIPVATHLPFAVSTRENEVFLTSHFSKANEHWKEIEKNQNLVIFSEPHAYISPSNYEKELNVPTWNYIAVHAYGPGKLITATDRVYEVLEQMIDTYELKYRQQWNKLPLDYKAGMAKGIVAFEIQVNRLQGKEKLSQNKTESERRNIIKSLSKGDSSTEQVIADYMKHQLKEEEGEK